MNDKQKFSNILNVRYALFAKKNEDYGSSFREEDIVGIVIRLGDKLKRLKKVGSNGYEVKVKEEGLAELLKDIANYCDIGLLLMEDKGIDILNTETHKRTNSDSPSGFRTTHDG